MAPFAATAAFIAVVQQQGGGSLRGEKGNYFLNKYSRGGVPARRRCVDTTITFPRNHNIFYAVDDGENIQSNSDENDDERKNVTKPLSPLAMAAADWLEEEEDELALYWDRYDVAKKSSSKEQPQSTPPQPLLDTDINTTTEERLDRYYESRNIDRGVERQHATQIKHAIETSKKASSADEAIQLLTPIRQYLQYNTKLGGTAYFELAQALDASDQVDEATDIYEKLASSPHVDIRRKSRELLAMGTSRRKRTYSRNVWNWFWDA
mmetsp:Transcript_5197/g.7246  ORF Transcript_5197/g.7246 Transcript_5197/m.7246 type:complete len:265 (+) Transcript_5197:45-839(+)